VLVDVCVRRGLDPVPFLLALAAAANVGSAATLIGNPQNMLIGQHAAASLSFGGYLADGAVPAALGLVVVWAVLARAYRGAWLRPATASPAALEAFDAWQTAKATTVLLLLLGGLLWAPVPREVLALAAGGLLLVSRTTPTRTLLDQVDWQLLVLFAGLFVVNAAFAAAGHAARGFAWLAASGVDVDQPATLFTVAVLGSNVVSNVPLTMLLLPATSHALAPPILALATTLAGNLLLVGSIANLIVADQAARLGVRIGWREHARVGAPVTALTLLIAAGWLAVRG
jgi:Na+/H+ antiporter NhaD/arsenite permease-like protein